MYLKKAHPYNPGYALPKRVFAEPDHRAKATFTEPRGFVDYMPYFPPDHPWNPGYAVPEEWYEEHPNQARTTPELPDHWVDYTPNGGAWIVPKADKYASMSGIPDALGRMALFAGAALALMFIFMPKKKW